MAQQKTACIYFKRESSAMAKDLAARVRNDGVKTTMIWSDLFRDEGDIEDSCGAVIIQHSAPKAELIATYYREFAAGVEIHFVDDDGEFEEDKDAASEPDGSQAGKAQGRGSQAEPPASEQSQNADAGSQAEGESAAQGRGSESPASS